MTDHALLAIETSGAVGSVALAAGGQVVERSIPVPRQQTESLLGHIDELLAQAGLKPGELDAVVFGQGPGSFTGLRVAAAVAQGLSFSTGVALIPVSSLAGLAQAVLTTDTTAAELALCLVDARMGEVYSGSYRLENGLAVVAGAELIGAPAGISPPGRPYLLTGNALAAHAEALAAVAAGATGQAEQVEPRARDLIPLAAARLQQGGAVPLEAALPVYLRQADAWRRTESG